MILTRLFNAGDWLVILFPIEEELKTYPKIKIMKRMLLFPIAAIFIVATLFAFTSFETEAEKEVKDLILNSYINGAFNDLDPEAMRTGFHPDFSIYSAKGEEIDKYPIATWAAGVEKRKNKADFDPAKNQWEHNFASVDVTGGSAAVKVELSHNGKHVYTDYLSLLKFESGWKIVAKVYHNHSRDK